MLEEKIKKLTPQQEALIPVYRDKWRRIALSTEPIDIGKAAEAVKEAYVYSGQNEPDIIFCDSICEALNTIFCDLDVAVEDGLYFDFSGELDCDLYKQLQSKLDSQLYWKLSDQFNNQLYWEFAVIQNKLYTGFDVKRIPCPLWACLGSWFDFCITVLNCSVYPRQWSVFQSLVKNCGWIYPYENIAVICDRPRILCFDNQNRLHAEGSPAIQFADGYSLYAYHGVTLPEEYGKLHPQEWQAKWLLEEKNAELRRVLIQGIGYSRISEELRATELDLYREYTLIKIDSDIDDEPINLLKMTCPSTGYIHVLRVPPDMRSAKDAIAWVNWGIYPEEFAVQT